jgi:hypothetical protein
VNLKALDKIQRLLTYGESQEDERMNKPKLSTTIACRVARLDRDRFNEAVAAGFFSCAPKTIPGRARYFDPDDMVSLWLYRELLEDGYTKERAGFIACEVGSVVKTEPQADYITLVNTYFSDWGRAYPADQVPSYQEWSETFFGGTDIRKVTTFNVKKIRALIAHHTAEELSYHGPED